MIGAILVDVEWIDTKCPDGTYSQDNDTGSGPTCLDHLRY